MGLKKIFASKFSKPVATFGVNLTWNLQLFSPMLYPSNLQHTIASSGGITKSS